MALNIFEKRIKAWEKKYGSLSPEIQRKINKLVENYDRTQNIEKKNKVLSITDGTKLVREFKGKRYSVTVIQTVMNITVKSTKVYLQLLIKLQVLVGMVRNSSGWHDAKEN